MLRAFFSEPKIEERAQATVWGTWPGDGGSSTVTVNQASAMQLLAVSGCVRLITDSISTLPVDVYREDSQGIKTEEKAPRWLKQPTTDLDFTAWCTQVLTSLLLHGNAFCVVTRSGSQIVELIPQDPSLISVQRVQGRKVFVVNGREFPGEMLHIPAMMLPGSDIGLSPLDYARQSIGLGLQAQEFASDQFGSSLNMPGVIELPQKAQPDHMRSLAQMWKRNRSSRNRGLPGVLDAGATWKPTGISNEAAQFLQARQWSAAEIAAQVYMVDPSDLGIPVGGTTLTYANLEQRNIRRLQVTFLPWIVRLEKALSDLLPMPRYVKFNVDGLLRGDSAARWSTYQIASNINAQAVAYGQPPVLLTSEMRDFEDLNYVEEYPGATLPVTDPAQTQMNAAPMQLHIHQAPTDVRVETPAVQVRNDVHVPEQRTPDVHVHNEPAAVVVDVQGSTVNIPPTEVRVNVAEQSKTTTRTVERDADGRIARVIDEVN
jgi:HK97 family phage portal protein